jgi:uncharacterized repeat protein (TIGR03803 family)
MSALLAVFCYVLAGQVTEQKNNTLHHFSQNSLVAGLGPPVVFTNSDGGGPQASLILSGNTLYGTASGYGIGGNGTVFKVNLDGGGFAVLHSFTIGLTNSDGAYPWGRLILSSNALFGTAYVGGNSGNGTVFAVNTDGTGFTTLHNFSSFPASPEPVPTVMELSPIRDWYYRVTFCMGLHPVAAFRAMARCSPSRPMAAGLLTSITFPPLATELPSTATERRRSLA